MIRNIGFGPDAFVKSFFRVTPRCYCRIFTIIIMVVVCVVYVDVMCSMVLTSRPPSLSRTCQVGWCVSRRTTGLPCHFLEDKRPKSCLECRKIRGGPSQARQYVRLTTKAYPDIQRLCPLCCSNQQDATPRIRTLPDGRSEETVSRAGVIQNHHLWARDSDIYSYNQQNVEARRRREHPAEET